MLNNPALLLFRTKDEDRLHFIAGSAKVNYRLSSNELDFSNCPAMSVLDYFWGNPTDTSISITPCTVKVRRNTSTAALFADKKANSNYKSTFNLQYVD